MPPTLWQKANDSFWDREATLPAVRLHRRSPGVLTSFFFFLFGAFPSFFRTSMPVAGCHLAFLPGGTAVQQGENSTPVATETAFLYPHLPRVPLFCGLKILTR